MKSTRRPIGNRRIIIWGLFLTLMFNLLLFSNQLAIAEADGVTEQEIRDAVPM